MSPEELKQLIKQHGKEAKKFEKDTILIGDAYLIQNFNFLTIEDLLNTWLGSLRSELGDEIIAYKFDDDDDSNCAFAPYIFEGERCIILVIRYWEQL
jgi:hypothetical protein